MTRIAGRHAPAVFRKEGADVIGTVVERVEFQRNPRRGKTGGPAGTDGTEESAGIGRQKNKGETAQGIGSIQCIRSIYGNPAVFMTGLPMRGRIRIPFPVSGKKQPRRGLKETGLPIGSIGLHHNDLAKEEDEVELGYWIGVPYWGQGLVPEASKEMLRHAFEDLNCVRVWCGYYDGNEKSRRVQEKLGFKYQWTTEDALVPLMGEKRRGHVSLLTKEQWGCSASN